MLIIVDIHYHRITVSTAAFLAATSTVAALASEKQGDQTINVNQAAHPKFQGISGVGQAARAYAKLKRPATKMNGFAFEC